MQFAIALLGESVNSASIVVLRLIVAAYPRVYLSVVVPALVRDRVALGQTTIVSYRETDAVPPRASALTYTDSSKALEVSIAVGVVAV